MFPVEVEHEDALPSCFSWGFLVVISEVLYVVPKHKAAMRFFVEKIHVLDKHCSCMSSGAFSPSICVQSSAAL